MSSLLPEGLVLRADVALLAGPTDRRSYWEPVAAAWPAGAGRVVSAVPDVAGHRPFGVAWVAAHASALHRTGGWGRSNAPLVLVAHGTAGPLLPALARTQKSAGRHIAGYVFVDATLPRPGTSTHLDLLRAAAPDEAEAAHHQLHEDGATWPVEADRPGDHEFWTESLPPVIDWPDAPCAYLATKNRVPATGPIDFWARSASARAWTVREVDGAPQGDELAGVLSDLIGSLPGT